MKFTPHILVLSAAVISLGCEKATPKTAPPKPTVEKFQCVRCHSIHDVNAPDPVLDCTGCHRAIMTDTAESFAASDVERWQKRIRHLALTPTLFGVERLQRSWFVEFVQNPHGLRPGFAEEMPRLPISTADAAKLADELGLRTEQVDSPIAGDVDRGAAVYEKMSCSSCHWFTGSGAPDGPSFDGVAAAATRRAPDLRFARERLDGATVNAWLEDPQAVKQDTLMTMKVTDPRDRADLVAFLMQTTLESKPIESVPEIPEPLDREVSWDEVNEKVFGAVCQHCHTTGGEALPGEGGAGNTGGFGYSGKGLVLSSHEGVVAGAGGRDVLKRDASGVAPIVRHMMARHAEVRGTRVKGVLGMPLGLPPTTLENIALVRTWIAQGAPGPTN